jgi:hypothetical protein
VKKMGRSLESLENNKHQHSMRSPEFRMLKNADKFPNCKGLYPDCPEKPSLEERACRTCPMTEDLEE